MSAPGAVAGSKRALETEPEKAAKEAKVSGRSYTAKEFRAGLFIRIEQATKELQSHFSPSATFRKEQEPITQAQFQAIKVLKDDEIVSAERIVDLCHMVLGTYVSRVKNNAYNQVVDDAKCTAFLNSIETKTPHLLLYEFDALLKNLPQNLG